MEEEKDIWEFLETTKSMVFECIRIIRSKGWHNKLEFIEWEDEINRLSTLDHNKPLFERD